MYYTPPLHYDCNRSHVSHSSLHPGEREDRGEVSTSTDVPASRAKAAAALNQKNKNSSFTGWGLPGSARLHAHRLSLGRIHTDANGERRESRPSLPLCYLTSIAADQQEAINRAPRAVHNCNFFPFLPAYFSITTSLAP